jgi:hypothetical protein
MKKLALLIRENPCLSEAEFLREIPTVVFGATIAILRT